MPAPEAEDEPIGDRLADCVAHVIALDLDAGGPSLDRVVRRLGLSRRTLQRRVEDSGTCYAEIHRRVMLARAGERLAETGLSIGRIAADLGDGDAARFTRAFLGWTGMTPRQRRARRPGP